MSTAVGPATSASPPSTSARTGSLDLAKLAPFAAAFAVAAVCLLAIDPSAAVGAVRDDAMYVVLAKSIATGQGYAWLNLPGAPAATHFPPGYPAVLALLWTMMPTLPARLAAFKILNALLSGVGAYGIARMMRARFDWSETASQAFAAAALLAAPAITLGTMVMSEPLFLALLLPMLVVAERLSEAEAPRMRDLVLLGVGVGLLTLVRTYGIAVIAAAALVFLRRLGWRRAALFAAVAVGVILPWQTWVGAHTGVLPVALRGNYESYGAWLIGGFRSHGIDLLIRTVSQTTYEIGLMLGHVFAPALPGVVRGLALALIVGLGGFGARQLWRRAPVSALFLAFHTAIVVCWPYTPGRFVWAVWPFVLLVPVLGAHALIAGQTWKGMRLSRPARLAVGVAAGLLALGYATYNVRGYLTPSWSTTGYTRYLSPIVAWAATVPPGAVIESESEGAVYVYSDRIAVPVGTFTVDDYFHRRTAAENAAVMREIVAHYRPARIVVASGWYRAAARELIIAQPPVLTPLDTIPGGGWILRPAAP